MDQGEPEDRTERGATPAPDRRGKTGVDELTFRRTLGHLATGVTVISTYTDAGVHGMTANAVMSLSLDPPLILVAIDRRARTARHVQTARAFCVNILRDTQEPLSRFFARSWRPSAPPEHRFEEWAGVPYLVGSLGGISCRVAEILDGGDHIIVLGRVVGLRVDDPAGRPLLFYRGRYATLVPHDDSLPESPELTSSHHIRVYYGEWSQGDGEVPPDRPAPPHPWAGD